AYALLPAIAFSSLRDGPSGFAAILFLFAAVWATDIFAYFTGRAIGGPKLAPAISPGKTWSGAVGGTVFAVLAVVALAFVLPALALPAILVPAIALSVVSQIGDLAESAFKRHFGVKDSGNFIPGHGGVMDRIDGLAVAAVALYLIASISGAVPGLIQ
ncbi:MAG: phosphatidate cytidylyltransferase, partial [Rhizobiaceae bacterium]